MAKSVRVTPRSAAARRKNLFCSGGTRISRRASGPSRTRPPRFGYFLAGAPILLHFCIPAAIDYCTANRRISKKGRLFDCNKLYVNSPYDVNNPPGAPPFARFGARVGATPYRGGCNKKNHLRQVPGCVALCYRLSQIDHALKLDWALSINCDRGD